MDLTPPPKSGSILFPPALAGAFLDPIYAHIEYNSFEQPVESRVKGQEMWALRIKRPEERRLSPKAREPARGQTGASQGGQP